MLVVGGGGGGGGRPDYLQKLKVPEGYEKIIDYSNIWHGTVDDLKVPAVSKPNVATKYALELESIWK